MRVFQSLFLQPPNAEFVKAIHDVIMWRPPMAATNPWQDPMLATNPPAPKVPAMPAHVPIQDRIATANDFWQRDQSMRAAADNWRAHYVSEPIAAHLVALILDKNGTVFTEEYAIVRLIGLREDIPDAYDMLDSDIGLYPATFPVGLEHKDERILAFLREHAPKECLQEILSTQDGNVHDRGWNALSLASGKVDVIDMSNWSDADDHLYLCQLGKNPLACTWFNHAIRSDSKIPVLRLS